MYTVKVIVNSEIKTLSVKKNEKLIDILNRNSIYIDAPCGGKCYCGKCKIHIKDLPYEDAELKLLSDNEQKNNIHLACAVIVKSDMTVRLLDERKANVQSEIIYRRNQKYSRGYGVAIDLGTTTIAAYLVNLENGVIVDRIADVNRQKSYGRDVISRMMYCIENEDGTEKLQNVIVNQIKSIIDEFSINHEISHTIIAGNTIMEHIMLGENPKGMAISPFMPTFLNGQKLDTNIFVMPCISSYIGGDIAASILACNIDTDNETTLLIDIGTNGEMVLKVNGVYYCCSVAAGPAFEGGHIKHGVGGVSGAINKVRLYDGIVDITTIDEKSAIGICGSGLVDVISQMIDNEIIDNTGKIIHKIYQKPIWRKNISADGLSFKLSENIEITQDDIRQFQFAKSAIMSGIISLIFAANIDIQDISRVCIGGGLGTFMDIESAVNVGLIPLELKGKIEICGNTSASGAVSVLCDMTLLEKAEDIRKSVLIVELANMDMFEKSYIENMNFPTV